MSTHNAPIKSPGGLTRVTPTSTSCTTTPRPITTKSYGYPHWTCIHLLQDPFSIFRLHRVPVSDTHVYPHWTCIRLLQDPFSDFRLHRVPVSDTLPKRLRYFQWLAGHPLLSAQVPPRLGPQLLRALLASSAPDLAPPALRMAVAGRPGDRRGALPLCPRPPPPPRAAEGRPGRGSGGGPARDAGDDTEKADVAAAPGPPLLACRGVAAAPSSP